MIGKRITATTRLVSQYDDAFILGFTPEQRQRYMETLDIKVLGDFSKLKVKPTIFVVSPLKTKYEYLIHSDNLDPWLIFAGHVESLENCTEIKLSHKQEIVDDEIRKQIPKRVVTDIALMIKALADKSGNEIFFSQSVASLRYTQQLLIKDATRTVSGSARSTVAKKKSSK